MITVVGMWERGYSEEQMFIEDTVWRQTVSAFAVDRFIMIPCPEYDTMQDALASTTGDRVFMCYDSEGAEPLWSFIHPEDAVYIFGRPGDNLVQYMNKGNYKVHIDTPNKVDMLGCSCVAAVLYDRFLNEC